MLRTKVEKIYNADGKVIRTSRNLAGIRRHVAARGMLVKTVSIYKMRDLSGGLVIQFENGDNYLSKKYANTLWTITLEEHEQKKP